MDNIRVERSVTESPLRARGNLNYIQFLQVLQKMWVDGHPDIPLVAQGGKEFSSYPVITYRLDLRKPIQNEPKPKLREHVITAPGEPDVLIMGQRFQNIITFTAFTNDNPQLAEEIIEVFEDFMIEFTPIFKELGVSDLFYARRLPDTDGSRGRGLGIVERSVSYMVTTEKIILTSRDKLESVLIDARIFVADPYWVTPDTTPATPISIEITDQYAS